MSEIRQVLAVCWSELRPIERRMTQAEKEWFRNFIRAYYLGMRSAAAQIAATKQAYFGVLSETSARRDIVSRVRRQNGYIHCNWLSIKITARPKAGRIPDNHLEEILIEFLDEKRSALKTAYSGSRPVPSKLASARFSALDLSIIEVHYRLTPW